MDHSPPEPTQDGDRYMDSSSSKPERRMFASVVFQAMLDAGIQSSAERKDRDDAHNFLSTPERVGPFLRMLGMDPESFCQRYREGGLDNVRVYFKKRLHLG